MSDAYLIIENPFASAQPGDGSVNRASEPPEPLSVRMGYATPSEKPEVTRVGYGDGGLLPTLPPIILSTNGPGLGFYGSGGYYYGVDGNLYPGGAYYLGAV